LVRLQQEIGRTGDIVTEGRDQGTVAFPHAECKIFLTATPQERARRRVQDLQERGESPSFEDVLAQQLQRDQRDSSRAVGPLVRAQDAVELVTDGMSIAEVVERLVEIVNARRH
jgi:cytidylate kinase